MIDRQACRPPSSYLRMDLGDFGAQEYFPYVNFTHSHNLGVLTRKPATLL
jgi:hypothetical protein